MFMTLNILMISVYVVSLLAVIYLIYLSNKDSRAFHKMYKEFMEREGKK